MFSGLRARLLLLVLLAVLPALGLLFYTGLEQRQVAAAEAQASALRLARIASAEHQRAIEGTRQLLYVLAQLPEVRREYPVACSVFFADILKQDLRYANLGAARPNGDVFCSALPIAEPVSVADRLYFRRALETRAFAVGEYQVGRITGRASVNFGYPVLDAAGRVQTVVFAALDLGWLNQIVGQAQLPPGATLTILDRNGIVLARHPEAAGWVGQPAPGPLLTTILAAGEGVAEAPGLDGRPRLYGFAPLGNATEAAYAYLRIGIPTDVAFAGVNRRLARDLAVLALATVLALAAAWFGGGAFIRRPARALVQAANRLAAGDLSARASLPRGRDELSQLARAFDDMAASVQKRDAEVRRGEARLGSIIDIAVDAVISVDQDQRILLFNNSAEQIFGYRAAEVIGKSHDILVPPRFVETHSQHLRELAAAPDVARRMSERRELVGRRKDGSEFPTEVGISKVTLNGQTIFTAILRDITERRRAEEQIQRQVQRLTALRAIDTAIAGSLDLRVALSVLLDQVTAQLRVDAAGVLLLNPHTQVLEYAAGRGFRGSAITQSRVRLGEGVVGRAALERRTLHIADLPAEGDTFGRASLLAGEGFVAYYVVPLVAKGQVKGVLEVFHRAPLTSDQEWLDFLEVLAGQAAIAVDNAVLFDDLQRSRVEVTLAYDTTLEGWARALELRDYETAGHSRRVTDMTLALARAMGVAEADLVHVRRGVLLHDIGKMAIPDSILLKPGPLTEEEWVVIRRHPVYAYELLSPVAYLRLALDIPYCHHEHWDGSGYPRGLKGEDIPLAARIFTVADAWDALLAVRPYKKAWPEAEAQEYLRAKAGSLFDPQVVELFLKMGPGQGA